jgi:hypothetical protein
MDVVNDFNGNYVCTFVKRKIRMRGGNTDQAVEDQRQLDSFQSRLTATLWRQL